MMASDARGSSSNQVMTVEDVAKMQVQDALGRAEEIIAQREAEIEKLSHELSVARQSLADIAENSSAYRNAGCPPGSVIPLDRQGRHW